MLLLYMSTQTDQQFLVENHLWQSQTHCYAERSHDEESFSLILNRSEEQSHPTPRETSLPTFLAK